MVISDELITSLKCCVYKNDHLVEEAVLLECGGNACEKCINFANKTEIKCCYCKKTHDIKSGFKLQPNPILKTMIKSYLKELCEMMQQELNNTIKSIQSKI
jgi:hypothetical protein